MAKNKTINLVKSQVIYKDYSKDAERTALVSGENLAHMFGKIARWYTDISWVGHTHTEANITDFGTYAGASTKGGAATSANKLNIGSADIGSETKPVYFSYLTGKPVACTYSLNASVPANAVFTDINVKQSPSTADESREVLFAGNTGNTETTGTVGKSNKLYFNPNTGALTATSFSGSMAASNLTGTIDAGRLPTTAVTAGSYGPAAGGTLTYGGTFDVPYVTVDKYGRLTAGSTKTFTMPAQYTHPTYTSKSSGVYKITITSEGHVSAATAATAMDIGAMNKKASCVNGANYNDFNTTGFFEALGNSDNPTQNAPNGNNTNNNFYVITQQRAASYFTQIATSVRSDKTMYIRSYTNSTWSDWVEMKFTDTVYVHPTYTEKANGLYKITVDATGHVSGTAAVTAADLPSHSHTLSLAADSGTSSIALSANTKYKLTAGGSTYVFTTPADTNTTYSAGTGLALDGTTFNLYMPRVTKDCNEALPGINKVKFEEFSNTSTNTPSAQWYHITTMEGEDNRYATQLALGMTTTRLFYRNYSSSSWSTWKEVSFSDHTHNYAGSSTPGGDANRALQSNNCKVDVTNASTSTAYGVVFVKDPETTEDNTLRKTNDFRINHFRGAANTEGITELVLGNNVAKTSTNNSSGHISLYNLNGKYTEIVPNTGSSGITITLPSSAGTLALVGDNNHTHNYVPNTQAGVIAGINLLSTGESTPTDTDYYIAQYAGGGTTNTSYHRRPHSALWSYINGKISHSNTGSGNAVTSISYSNGVITATKGATFASSTHTHGTLYDSFVTTLDTTTNTWAAAGLNGTGHVIKSIRTNTNAPAYLLNDFSAGIGFGGGDTRGVISVKYNTPIIRFAGGNRTATNGGTATWYFTLSATSAQTYTFPTTGGTLTDIIYKASNYYATASHTHSEYLPLAGGNMTGDLSFASVTSTEYPAVSKQIIFGGSTDGGQIFFEVTGSDKGCLVLQTTDDPDAKIVFRNKVTSGGTRANEVTITDGVLAGNGSGLTNLNASNISSGTIAAERLPAAYLPLAGGTMSGLIKGGRGYTHLALGTDSYTNDYGGLEKFNNVDINTWWGFSVSNACNTVGTLNQVVFSVNARTGNVYARTGIYVGSTKVSLEGHTHNYVPNTEAGLIAAINLLQEATATPIDDCCYITQDNAASNNNYFRRKHSALWDYIKGKITSSTTGSGNAVTAVSYSGGVITVTKGSTFSTSGHTHSSITGTSKHAVAVPTSTVGTGVFTIFYNVDGTGVMPKSNNANAIIQFNKHSGEYDSQLGFSSNGNIYYRSANGSAFAADTPWKQLAWNDEKLGAKSDGSYYGMTSPTLADDVWIRTTSLGIIPYQSGVYGSGHCSLGTSSWYFGNAYIDTMHGYLDGTAARSTNSNNCATTVTDASSGTYYGIVFVADPNTSEDNTLRKTNDFRLCHWRGAANTEGTTEIILGNNVAKTSANNSSGIIYLYNGSGKWTAINSALATANTTITLPSTGGNMTNVVYKTGKTLSAASHSNWTGNATDDYIVPTMSFIAFWNGAYSSGGGSNLAYCNKGAFGTIVTKATNDYLAITGGTMTGDINFTGVSSTSYPARSNQIYFSGSTDWAKIYYRVDSSDAGRLVLDLGDDTNTRIDFAYNGTTKSYIDTSGNFSGNAATSTTATNANYVNIVATNEIRFNASTKPSSAMDLYIGYCWSDGNGDAKINSYIFQNGNRTLTTIKAASIYLGNNSGTQGSITLCSSNKQIFSIVASPDATAGGGITLPPTSGLMTDIVYKASSGTYGALGKVENTGCIASLTAEGISSHQSRASSTQSFGGTYTISGGGWHNMLSIRHRNGASDGGSYGFYLRNSLTSSSSLVYNQQYGSNSWRGEATIVDSLNVSSYAVPNTEAGMSAAINKLSTGTSTPADNDYYVAQYAGGGTATTSYHRRPVSALFAYINSKLYKILWSGSTSCTARSSTSITLTTAISANKYRFIKVVWNCGTYTGTSEFRADTLNVTNNIPSGSDATTTNMIQFKIASDGKSVSVGPGTTTITVIQIAGVYPI